MSAVALAAQAETVTWNVQTKYGISASGIRKAVRDAKEHFAKTPDDVVVLEFDAGSIYLEDKSSAI